MITNKKLNILGVTTQTIAIILTLFLILFYLLSWYLDFSKEFGLLDSLAFLGLIILTLFIGYFNVNLYTKYKNYLNEKIAKHEYNKNWYGSFISSMVFALFFIGVAIIEKQISALIPIIIMIPQMILLKIIHPNKDKVAFKIKCPKNKFKINMKQIAPANLTIKEIYVISAIIGAVICLLLGYIFGETQYYKATGKRVYYETEHSFRRFNYVIGIISFIISSGISYLVLSKKFNNSDN